IFISIYAYNRVLHKSISVSVNGYSVAKTFQIRENCRIMECMMSFLLPFGFSSSIGFAFFCYFEWAPTEWELSRYIAIALFDLFVAISLRYFEKRIACKRKAFQSPTYKKSALKTSHKAQPGKEATSESYFAQFNNS
ncbi:hypothetical protein PMAYCL1PPCAC_26543, partial [Pristionchus mayeri]